jgi:hypothetical protein
MGARDHKQRRDGDSDGFYEAIPYSQAGKYDSWADEADGEPPDHDFAAIEDDGRAIAIRTLVFVAVSTVILCLLLIWGIQLIQQMAPATAPVQT